MKCALFTGGKDDPVNEEGIAYYNKMIDALLENKITPYVTIFHWDLPLALQMKYQGFRSPNKADLIEDYISYSDLLFSRFGDRVKNWITLNEPWVYTIIHALGNPGCDFEKDPWTVAHHQILAHAHAVDLHRRNYNPKQQGKIGITLNIDWTAAIDESKEAKDAADLANALGLTWFADPIYKGRNSEILQSHFQDELLDFTPEEWKLIKGSSDFFGLNHYGTKWATGKIESRDSLAGAHYFQAGVEQVVEKDGKLIGRKAQNGQLYAVSWGFRQLLDHVHQEYAQPNDLGIIITENGFAIENEHTFDLEHIVNDKERQEYFDLYLTELCEAAKRGTKIDGYMGWSLLDNLEWNQGYMIRFGVTYVDRENGFKRYPKDSTKVLKAIWEHAIRKPDCLTVVKEESPTYMT